MFWGYQFKIQNAFENDVFPFKKSILCVSSFLGFNNIEGGTVFQHSRSGTGKNMHKTFKHQQK